MQLLTLIPVVWCSLVRDEVDVQPLLPFLADAEGFQVPGVRPTALRAAAQVPLGERAEVPTMAHHVQKKATKHHEHSRPRKSRPSDINRKPTDYPELPDIPWYTVTSGSKSGSTSKSVQETPADAQPPASRAGEPQMMANRPHLNRPSLNKPADQRKAMLRALTTEVLRHGRIRCTLARAKEVRRHVDHMVTLAKDGSLHARRQALGYVYDKQLVHGIFEQVPERYSDRKGGYTRVVKDGFRRGDNAEMGIVELV